MNHEQFWHPFGQLPYIKCTYMKIAKTVITALLLITCTVISAQKPSAIIRGGINIANVTITNDGDIDEANSLTSFQAGILGDFPIISILSFQAGALVTGKGSKTQSGDPSSLNYSKATSNPIYIEIPANLVVKTPTGPIKFFAGAGPYIAIGIAGKLKNEGKI